MLLNDKFCQALGFQVSQSTRVHSRERKKEVLGNEVVGGGG